MKAGILFLVLGYVLSQFYRSFLAVLTPVLGVELGATSSDLSFASGLWFIVFATMQIPVGWALDRYGPRLTAGLLLAIGGGGGAIVFATASSPGGITAAMALFGIGGSPVLMAAYYIFARMYPQAMFASLAGATIGFGSVGNLAGASPLAYAVEVFGWRESMWALALAALLVAAALLVFLRDPPRDEGEAQETGNLLSLLTNRHLLLIIPLMIVLYGPTAAIRGLWAGPYFENVFGLDQIGIGRVTLMMGIAMALGSFAYGPAERLIGSKKTVIMGGNLSCAFLCLALWAFPSAGWLTSAILITAIGFFGASFPALMAHGQLFMPRHLTGRGMTMLNMFGIGGVGLMQLTTSWLARAAGPEVNVTPEFFGNLFLLFAISVLVGCAIYAFSTEK
ncbi:MAG: MFS transporter [Marinosulfonomonas sp.]|nr:MFS transporter [Marinosulfonomonas sp.]